MKQAALRTKILARQAKNTGSADGLLRFLSKKCERTFVSDFVKRPKDLHYYLALWRGIRTLDAADRAAMTRVIGMEIDLQNIVWLYRLKQFYGVYGHDAYSFLIPIRHRLTAHALAKMAQCSHVAALLAEVARTPYQNVFDNFTKPEQKLAEAVKKRYKAEGKRSHIALLCGYLEVHQ